MALTLTLQNHASPFHEFLAAKHLIGLLGTDLASSALTQHLSPLIHHPWWIQVLLILGCLLPATGFERVCLWIANLDGGSGANETLVLQAMPPPLLVMLLCECELAMVPGVVLAVLLVGMTTTV